MKISTTTSLVILLASPLISCGITHSVLTNDHYKVGKLTVFDACIEGGVVTAWAHSDLDGSFEIKFPSSLFSNPGTCYVINDSIISSKNRNDFFELKTCNNIRGTIYNPKREGCYIENSVFAADNTFKYLCKENNNQVIRFVRKNTFPFRYILTPFLVTADIISFPFQLWQYHKAASDLGNEVYGAFFGMWSSGNEQSAGCIPLPNLTEHAQLSAADGRSR